MSPLEDRQQKSELVTLACNAGARLAQACGLCSLSERTLQRWRSQAKSAKMGGDQLPHVHRSNASHALGPVGCAELLRAGNEPRFADLPLGRIVPLLADEDRYLASESSFARVLRQAEQNAHSSRSRAPRAHRPSASPEQQAKRGART